MPKVSVIIPVYGVEKYIERCARSLFEQTLDDIEYLFVDDCTPDKSIEILMKVLDKYPERSGQVVIHRMEQNSGQAIVRKWGMQNAKGEYVIHCDSDDWIDIDMYKSMYEKGKEENADIVVCDYKITDGLHSQTKKGLYRIENCLSDMMYSKISWSLWNKLVKRIVYKDNIKYSENNVGEDMALVLQMMRRANRISYIQEGYYHYFYNPISTMNRHDKKNQLDKYNQMYANIKIIENDFKDKDFGFDVNRRLNAMKFYCQILLIPILNKEMISLWKKRFDFSIMRKYYFNYCTSYIRKNKRGRRITWINFKVCRDNNNIL